MCWVRSVCTLCTAWSKNPTEGCQILVLYRASRQSSRNVAAEVSNLLHSAPLLYRAAGAQARALQP